MRGLFTGVGPRVARAAPSTGIVVSFYEVVKYVLHRTWLAAAYLNLHCPQRISSFLMVTTIEKGAAKQSPSQLRGENPWFFLGFYEPCNGFAIFALWCSEHGDEPELLCTVALLAVYRRIHQFQVTGHQHPLNRAPLREQSWFDIVGNRRLKIQLKVLQHYWYLNVHCAWTTWSLVAGKLHQPCSPLRRDHCNCGCFTPKSWKYIRVLQERRVDWEQKLSGVGFS
jgi:hypothetical protein